MGVKKVREHFETFGLADRIVEFDESSATAEMAAHAVGCDVSRIAKTLSFCGGNACAAILIVTSGDTKVDNSKFKAHFETRPKMLSPDDAEAIVGYRVGGVCPFAVGEGVRVYLDESLRRFDSAVVACGSSNSVARLSIDELVSLSCSLGWVDVCKPR